MNTKEIQRNSSLRKILISLFLPPCFSRRIYLLRKDKIIYQERTFILTKQRILVPTEKWKTLESILLLRKDMSSVSYNKD